MNVQFLYKALLSKSKRFKHSKDLIAAYLTLLLIPFAPCHVHGLDLDASWQIALHVAHSKGLIFGKDVIFTYGPLFWLTTRFPLGIPGYWYVALDLFILVNTFVIYRHVLREYGISLKSIAGIIVFAIPLIILSIHTDIFFSIFLAFYICRFIKRGCFYSLLLAGLLTLVTALYKINLGVTSFAVFSLAVLYKAFFSRSEAIQALGVWVCVTVAFAFSGSFLQVDVWGYLVGGFEEVRGYNNGFNTEINLLSLENPNTDNIIVIQHYLSFGVLLTLAVLIAKICFSSDRNRDDIILAVILGIYFYTYYKHMTIRGNPHSVFIAFNGVLAIVATFLIGKNRKHFVALSFFILLATFTLRDIRDVVGKKHISMLFPVANVSNYFGDNGKEVAIKSYEKTSKILLPEKIRKIVGDEKVDVFPLDVATLFYAGLNYYPRPTIQSYNSYTRYLDNENYKFYLSTKAPKYVLYNREQGYYNTITDGLDYQESLTKLALLRRYSIVYADCASKIILLKQNEHILPVDTVSVVSKTIRYDQPFKLDQGEHIEILSFDMEYSFLGKMTNLIFKAPNPYLLLGEKEHTKKHRVQPSVLQSEVRLSHAWLCTCENAVCTKQHTDTQGAIAYAQFSGLHAWAYQDSFLLQQYVIRICPPSPAPGHIPL